MTDMSAETLRELLQQTKEETNRRLDKVDSSLEKIYSVLDRFLVVDSKVTALEKSNEELRTQIQSLRDAYQVTQYRRTWADKVLQAMVCAAALAVITAVVKFILVGA